MQSGTEIFNNDNRNVLDIGRSARNFIENRHNFEKQPPFGALTFIESSEDNILLMRITHHSPIILEETDSKYTHQVRITADGTIEAPGHFPTTLVGINEKMYDSNQAREMFATTFAVNLEDIETILEGLSETGKAHTLHTEIAVWMSALHHNTTWGNIGWEPQQSTQ